MALPDYEGWACFVAVADSGGFTAAASALGLSKASVSKAVSRLEASLGITLLHRSSRSVTVSTAGAGLLEEARAMVAAATAATEAAHGDRFDPVSYTHLDVYKRQASAPSACAAISAVASRR